jgi:hypothetical protein
VNILDAREVYNRISLNKTPRDDATSYLVYILCFLFIVHPRHQNTVDLLMHNFNNIIISPPQSIAGHSPLQLLAKLAKWSDELPKMANRSWLFPAPASHPASRRRSSEMKLRGLRTSYTTFTETRSPLQNSVTPTTVVITTADMASPPLQRTNTVC